MAMTVSEAWVWIEAACAPKDLQEAFRVALKDRKKLVHIATLCKEEIDHGFDLPSEIFDATEDYFKVTHGNKKPL